MSALVLMLVAIVVTIVAYFTYGSFVARRLGVSNVRPTPAHTHGDGVDYVPTSAPVVLGHHFASIAGAGPIVGPIFAVAFGWIPAFLWILFGVVFIGSVHDFTTMVASIRHGGRSIGDVVEDYIGLPGKRLFILFAFSALILVIGVFADIVAKTFVGRPEVATASALFIALAVVFGVGTYRLKLPLLPLTLAGIAAMVGCVALAAHAPIVATYEQWVLIVLAYIFFAAVTPVWALLQPRDYLNSFLLYAMMLGGVIGLCVARPTIAMDGFTGWHHESLGFIFPILFVTVACGSISGFHSLVASGTTSKQIDRETDAKVVGYGGMLIEGLLAVLALIAAAVLSGGDYAAQLGEVGPIAIFSSGVGSFMSAFGVPLEAGVTFVALAVSAFALTSLDTCTRLARFLVAEFFETADNRGRPAPLIANRFVGTGVVVLLGGGLCLSGQFSAAWPIFGSANQLLAALALLSVSVWLAHKGIENRFVVLPMVFMFVVTIVALSQLLWTNFQAQNWVLTVLSSLLLGLAFVLIAQAAAVLRRSPGPEEASA